jgi:hypothetical protein
MVDFPLPATPMTMITIAHHHTTTLRFTLTVCRGVIFLTRSFMDRETTRRAAGSSSWIVECALSDGEVQNSRMKRLLLLAAAFAILSLAAVASPLGPDGVPGTRLHGKFVWFDLATEDPAASKAFYGAVFGWKFRESPGVPASYTLIENDGGKVGGMFRHVRPAGAANGARWLPVMSVSDVSKAAQVVREQKGEVLVAPAVVPGRGTHAVFRDPGGAAFGVIANDGGDPADTPVTDGDVFWLDLFTHDTAKAAGFYSAVGGFEVDVGEIAGRPRTLLSTNGVARAGITHLPADRDKATWIAYVLVDDVPGTLARATRAGGKVLIAPRANLLGGNVAVIADPQGGVIGIVNWVDGTP